jgi:hypothetical protein
MILGGRCAECGSRTQNAATPAQPRWRTSEGAVAPPRALRPSLRRGRSTAPVLDAHAPHKVADDKRVHEQHD